MKTSIHGRVSNVPLDVAQSVKTPDGVAYSRILSPQEATAQKGRAQPNVFRFGFMFSGIAKDANNRLPEGDMDGTAKNLRDLSASMEEPGGLKDRDGDIAAAYTYLGQFIDHDITKTETISEALASNMEAAFQVAVVGKHVAPLSADEMAMLVNKRMPALNLDSVLSSAAPRDAKGALEIGPVAVDGVPPRPTLPSDDGEPPALHLLHDLPRNPPSSTNEELDRRAKIGDPRNDENLVIAQLHVAFLRAHRRLVHENGLSAANADLELQRSFQAIVIQDFLPVVCDPAIVSKILAQPGRFYKPSASDPFMPLEFSVAAYRFGHSMVRGRYDYNSEFSGQGGKDLATLADLFTFTAFSGQNFGIPTLPQNWIIDWTRWLPDKNGVSLNVIRKIDTLMAGGLMKLPQHQGVIGGTDVNILALRNLVRGYLLGLPTGQAVAKAVQKVMPEIEVLKAADIRAVAKAAGEQQLQALVQGQFDERTPLWYYMLAEAAHVHTQKNVSHLGPIASVIITEVLVQLVKLANDNFTTLPGWKSKIPQQDPQKLKLADLLRFAQVLPATVA